MSNLSFARIMYGTSPEVPSASMMPVSNLPSQFLKAPSASSQDSQRASTGGTVESFFHKAWLAFSSKE
jgi:hypothetical protein